jgi:hypothetical protein
MTNPALEYIVVHIGNSHLITELTDTLNTHGEKGWKLVLYDANILIFSRVAEVEENDEAKTPES